MSANFNRSILVVLWAASIFALFGCAAPTSQPSPPEQKTATLTPLSIPKSMELPQPQSQRASTPPTIHIPTPEPGSSSQLLKDQENLPKFLQQGAPVPQVGWMDIVGIWASQEETGYGTVYSQVVLERTGTYSLISWWLDLLAYETGTYYVGDGFIHFMLDNYEPKIYKGRWMSRPMSWTAWYTIVDENTLVWEDRIIGTQWTVYRQ